MSDEMFNLPDLSIGKPGLRCEPDEMIEVPANLIIELARIFERENIDYVLEHHYQDHPGKTNWIRGVIAQTADTLEQKHETPITNRNRKYSKNRLV